MRLFVILMIGVTKVSPVGESVLLLILVSKNHDFFGHSKSLPPSKLWVEHCEPCGQHQKIKFSIQIDPVVLLLPV
jgi:hypothetical protein